MKNHLFKKICSLLLVVSVFSTGFGCANSGLTESKQGTKGSDQKENGEIVFSVQSNETATYYNSTELEADFPEDVVYHGVFGGTVLGSSAWVFIYEEDSFYIKEYNLEGKQVGCFPIPCQLQWAEYCSVFENNDSLVIALSDYNAFEVIQFSTNTHEMLSEYKADQDDSMHFGDVIGYRDGVVYISMWSETGTFSCRGYQSSDGSLAMKIEGELPSEGFFWCDNQMYALGRQLDKDEYELYVLSEAYQLAQVGRIKLPEYARNMRNSNGNQYLIGGNGLWVLDEESKNWKCVVDWTKSDVLPTQISEYSFSKNTESILLWRRDGQTISMISPGEDPTLGKTTLSVIGSFEGNEKYSWVVSEFNEQSERYSVELVDYDSILDPNEFLDSDGWVDLEAYEEALSDYLWKQLVQGDGPDIFIRSMGDNALDSKYYEYGGLFVDLQQYYANMDENWQNQFIGNVMQSTVNNGRLYTIPLSFDIFAPEIRNNCNIGPEATYVDWNSYMNENADGRVLFWETGSDYLRRTLCYDITAFINCSTNEAHFDSDEFRSLLQLSKNHCFTQQEYENGSERESLMVFNYITASELYAALRGNEWSDTKQYGCISNSGAENCLRINEMVSVSTNCQNLEGAWEFICFLLSSEAQEYDLKNVENSLGEFPVRWDSMESLFDFLKNPKEHESYWREMSIGDDDWTIDEIVPLSDEETLEFTSVLESTNLVMYADIEIIDIVMEETAPYFSGQKSEDEVIDVINNRVQTLLDERST